MKKFLALAIILSVVTLSACKKDEKKPATEQPAAQSKQPEFKPKEKKGKKEGGKNEKVVTSLQIYQEDTLVTTVPQAQYPTMTTTKIKMGGKQLNAIPLKELLAKNNIKSGKSVLLAGEQTTAKLTWEQANAADLYVYMTPKKFLKVQPNKGLIGVKFPKRLDKITVSASDVAAAKPADNKKPSNQ